MRNWGGSVVERFFLYLLAQKLSHALLHFGRDVLVLEGSSGLDGFLVSIQKRDTVRALAQVAFERPGSFGIEFSRQIVHDEGGGPFAGLDSSNSWSVGWVSFSHG